MSNQTSPIAKTMASLAIIGAHIREGMAQRQEEQHSAELKEAQKVRGFVRPIPPSKTAHNKMPTLVGLFVVGNQGARVIYADRRAPEWFLKAIEEESTKSNPIQFRVRVGSISKNGSSAFVWPMAKDLVQAKKEWQNEQRKTEKDPKVITDCKDKIAVARYAYGEYARAHGGVIVDFKSDKDKPRALMVKAPFFQKTVVLTGGEDIWLYTDGIARGNTSLEEEIERNIKVAPLF